MTGYPKLPSLVQEFGWVHMALVIFQLEVRLRWGPPRLLSPI